MAKDQTLPSAFLVECASTHTTSVCTSVTVATTQFEDSQWKVLHALKSLRSSLFIETNLIIPSGDVTTFVEKDGVKSPFDIAMNHKANCFYVVNNDAHTITKITSSGFYTTLLSSSSSFLPNFLWSMMVNSPTHMQELSVLLLEVENKEALTEMA